MTRSRSCREDDRSPEAGGERPEMNARAVKRARPRSETHFPLDKRAKLIIFRRDGGRVVEKNLVQHRERVSRNISLIFLRPYVRCESFCSTIKKRKMLHH